MNAHSLERLTLENELRRAVEREELVLHYQPQMSLRSGEIIAWRRWCAGSTPCAGWFHRWHSSRWPRKRLDRAHRRMGAAHACVQNQAWQAAGCLPWRWR